MGTEDQVKKKKLSIRDSILWNTLGNFAYLFVQWLLTYLVVIILGFTDAGLFSLAMSIGGSLFCIASYSMRSFQVSDVKDAFSDKTYIFSRYCTSVVSILVCVVFIAVNGYSSTLGCCILLYMAFKVTEAISDVYQGILQRNSRMDIVGISLVLKSICLLVCFTATLLLSKNLLISILSLSLVSFLIVYSFDRKKAMTLSGNLSQTKSTEILKLLKTCLPVAGFGFLFNTMGQVPRLFLEAQMGAEALGVYAAVAMPVVIVQVSASFVFSPLITPLATCLDNNDRRGFNKLVIKVIVFIGILSLSAVVIFWFFGDYLLLLFYGDQIKEYSYLLMPLVICTVLMAISWFMSTVVVVLRKLMELLFLSAISIIIVLCGSSLFINIEGMNGASFILMLSLSIFSIGCTLILIRSYQHAHKVK